jgi:hypothetical protein
MKPSLRPLTGILLTLAMAFAPLARAHDPASEMLAAAQNFIKSLDCEAKSKALFPFDSERREAWNFLPDMFIKPDGKRYGLPVKEMTVHQRILAHGLLASSLSHKGYLQASTIRTLEAILFELENGREIRQPDLYYVSIFGEPAPTGTWGWRYEGHHISVNFTLVNGRVFSVTPSFFATNPAEVKEGKFKGLRVLPEEEDLARQLAKSLNNKQKPTGILSDKAPKDILSTWDPTVDRKTFFPAKGIKWGELNGRQQGLVKKIIEAYTSKHRDEIVGQIDHNTPILDTASLHFAWMGSLEPGQGHYYRIQTKDWLFEYDCTQNDANHIHSVWRSFDGDFGRDLLAEHYASSHSNPEAGFQKIFNGKNLDGWKPAAESPGSFYVKDGNLVSNGNPRSHLFYVGDKKPFKNFEFRGEVLIFPHSNAGIYFHTAYQESSWPKIGFEAQVCSNDYHDPKKTGSLYGVVNVDQSEIPDDTWFDYNIHVEGKRVVIKINDKVTVDYTEPEGYKAGKPFTRKIDKGTFAIQAHDPKSTVLFRNLRVKRLD